MLMRTGKVATKAVIKMPHLKVSTVKKRGPKPIGALVTPPAATHIFGDKQPGTWGAVDSTTSPTCNGESGKSRDVSHQDPDYPQLRLL